MVCNRGSSYKFVLNELPFAREEIFVDASSSGGVGGFQGDNYFLIPNQDLEIFQKMDAKYHDQVKKLSPPRTIPIAYWELLAAMVGVVCFIPSCSGQIVRLNSDNSDAVAWL